MTMREHPDYCYEQSAVIPVRRVGDTLEILMITSRQGKRWIIPKGIIEPDLSPADSAAKEALEEAGVMGVVLSDCLGTFRYEKWGDFCEVQVFVMRVTEILDTWEEDFRQRVWLDLAEAVGRIREQGLQELLEALPAFWEKQV